MTVLVVGAGMLGRALASALRDEAVVVVDVSVDRLARLGGTAATAALDVTRPEALGRLIERHGVTAICHTAGAVGDAAGDEVAAWRGNVLTTAGVLRAALSTGIRRVVHASSLSVYGATLSEGKGPVPEEAPLRPVTAYGRGKARAEELVAAFGRQTGREAVSLRLCGMYGAVDDPGGGRMAAALARAVGRSGPAGSVVRLPGWLAGQEFLHVDDGAAAMRAALTTAAPATAGLIDADLIDAGLIDAGLINATGVVHNVSPGRVETEADIAAAFRATTGADVMFDGPTPGPTRPLDADRARRALGLPPVRDLRQGLADMANDGKR
jgi:UDP-glucose 4-epimerase